MPANRQQNQHKQLTCEDTRQHGVSRCQHSQQNSQGSPLLLTVLTFADARQQLISPAQGFVLILLTLYGARPPPALHRSPSATSPARPKTIGDPAMRIRLHGTEDECHRTAGHLAEHLDVLDTSRPYPNRPPSRLVRLT